MAFGGVVALDGPSGTGKSTVATRVARRLGARYLDTGAMYRAATWAVLQADVDPTDAAGVTAVVDTARIEIGTDPDRPSISVDGVPVDRPIRGAEVTAAVSAVSAVPAVRTHLVAMQQQIIGTGGIVVEGRDIGTVVAPEAEPKIYLTASAAVRAKRRSRQDRQDVAAVSADLHRRDTFDSSRATSPLRQAADAVLVDTSALSLDEVVDRVLSLVPDASVRR
ncbi:MAG TPA: (d)CMP kinase [Mycobacteriales bacterium]|nr:(d)CMP kinase [Mycobacteriales bacterium]